MRMLDGSERSLKPLVMIAAIILVATWCCVTRAQEVENMMTNYVQLVVVNDYEFPDASSPGGDFENDSP